jgi:hAT family C-terminal dimerisation region
MVIAPRWRLKTSHRPEEPLPLPVGMYDQYIVETAILPLGEAKSFDPILFWNGRHSTQPDLARMALDVLALPAMSDECERLFSNAKLLLADRRSHLRINQSIKILLTR